ncbi:FMN-binding protein [Clostridioides difficile]
MKQQSLDVDAITSATYSSNTIRKAVENALRKGE